MEENPKIIICDCDHNNVDTEKAVFDGAGVAFKWLQCHTEEEAVAQCQGAVCLVNQYCPMNEKVFKGIPTLKFIVRYGVGVDNVNLADATRYGVQVCNVPDYGMNEVADQAMSLLLACVRKTWVLGNRVQQKAWDYAEAIPVRRISTLTVGIVGTGRIGSEMAKRLKPFGCKIIAFDTGRKAPGRHFPEDLEYCDSLQELLSRSDVVTLHCSLNADNQKMMNAETFAQMKDGSFFINVSRGGLVDEAALDAALTSGKLAGAGIDVVTKEPLDHDSPLFGHPNLMITPHMAWYSEEAALELKRKCAEEAVAFLQGKPLRYPVNTL
jgi:D-3-phosphoglycerate dehydrogenase